MKSSIHNNPFSHRLTTMLANGQTHLAMLMGVGVISAGVWGAMSAPGAAAPSRSTRISPSDISLSEISLSEISLSGHAKAYRPPADTRPPRGPFIPGARRTGCGGAVHNGLTAIAPHQQVGRTFSTQPTLTWFMASATPYPLTLQLYEYTHENWTKLSDVELGASQPGYGSYTVPASAPLRVGGVYRWNIVMECDRARPSRNRVDTAQFEVVSPPAGLVSSANSRLTQAQQNAAAGFWYDAIALVATSQAAAPQAAVSETVSSQATSSLAPNAPLSPEVLDYRKTLLLTLSEFESPEFGEQLQFILDVEDEL